MVASEHERNQVVDYIGIGMTALTVLLYCRILFHQHGFVAKNPLTFRLAVLNVRIALLVPGFAICYLMALIYPRTYLYMQLPEAFIQAYSVFCFFALFILYVGGPDKCIEVFKSSKRTWPDCLFKNSINANPRSFYQFVYWSLLQFIAIRPLVVVAQVVTGYLGLWMISDAISVITSLMVAWAIVVLLKLFHILYDHCHGLNAMTKVTVIKGIIGLVLGEGFIEQVLFAFGVIQPTATRRSVRLYCFAVLAELLIISVVLERVFSSEIKVEKAVNPDFQPHIVINERTDGVHVIHFCEYVAAVGKFFDVFGPVMPPGRISMDPLSKEVVLAEMISPYFGAHVSPGSPVGATSTGLSPGTMTDQKRFTLSPMPSMNRLSIKPTTATSTMNTTLPQSTTSNQHADSGGEFL